MTDYAADLAKYTKEVDQEKIEKLIKHLGIALRTQDGSLVSVTDPEEIDRIRKGFATKKLGLTADQADEAIAKVNAKMAAAHFKNRVTYYYLLAEETGNLDKI